MSTNQIEECCKELCAEFNIKRVDKCKSILQAFFPQQEVKTTTEGCTSIIKSGERKNKPCGQTVVTGTNFCKRHTPKDEEKTPSTPKPPAAPKGKKTEIQNNTPVLKQIEEKRESFRVQKNKFNNFVHKETNFVFNQQTHKVIGVQNDDGTIAPLSTKDIELCKDNKWEFEIPDKVRTSAPIVAKRKPTVTVMDDDDDEDDEEDETEN